MALNTMTLAEAQKWIEENKTKEFKVRFIKADLKTIRSMRCATGIKDEDILVDNPYRRGTDFKKAGLVSVYDLDLRKYRCFDPQRLLSIEIDGIWYPISDNNQDGQVRIIN